MGRPRKHTDDAEKMRAHRRDKKEQLRNAEMLRNDKQLFKIERPALRYYGGKSRVGHWIIDQFPDHSCYVEAFAGGASVMLQKSPSRFEVMNDLDGRVINFFRALRDKTEHLIRAVLLTPYSREELRLCRTLEPVDDPVEMARRFYVRCWQSYGSGTGTSSTGWRFQIGNKSGGSHALGSFNRVDHLWAIAERLKQVQIESDDALKVIERFDSSETVFYLDPPYVHSTRYHSSKDKGYAHEMSDADHTRLAELARRVQGYVIISGYTSPLYDELYAGWQTLTRMSRDVNGKEQTEVLWLSPRVSEDRSLPLFRLAAG